MAGEWFNCPLPGTIRSPDLCKARVTAMTYRWPTDVPGIASITLRSGPDWRVARRQTPHSILAYMASDRFSPQTSIGAEDVRALFCAAGPAPATADSWAVARSQGQ